MCDQKIDYNINKYGDIALDKVDLSHLQTLPAAAQAMQLLYHSSQKQRFPFVFITNGGGDSEAAKAKHLSDMLRVPITPDQVILSHTPMQVCIC
jgi:ribonucleotide monophosphatase NagD (HAD superfamily)